MPIDYCKLMNIEIPDVDQRYSERDTIIYALGVGLGWDPLNEDALAFCYEKALKSLPTMPLVLAHPGFWMRDLDTGIDWKSVVHGEQELELYRPLAPAGRVLSKSRVADILDKGVGKGAIVKFERRLYSYTTGELIATMRQTNFCRADGGFGGPSGDLPRATIALPKSVPDRIVDLPTRPETALLYRLSADLNPIHVESGIARSAGFPRPILHGLATFGVVGHAILKAICGYANDQLRSMSGRFIKPVFPGESIRTEIWVEGNDLTFQATALERNVVVLNGRAAIRGQGE